MYIYNLFISNEIDDALLMYTKSLIQKEYQRVLGPTATITDYNTNNDDNDNNEDISNNNQDSNEEKELLTKVSTTGAKVVDVLTQILNRLEAELEMKDKNDLKLISQLLYESTPEVCQVVGS